jgi:hypothetical protein
MLTSLRSKFTYANVAATLALFLALSGGVAYAANTVFSTDIVDGEVKTADVNDGAVTSHKLAADSVGPGKVLDFSLSNEDVGVLFAEVRSDAILASSSGAVTVQRVGGIGTGNYSVRFGRAVNNCAAVATIGSASTTRTSGQINVADRVGDSRAVFVDTNDDAGKAADRPFRLVVVC